MTCRGWTVTLILALIGAFSLSVWLGSVDLTAGQTIMALTGRGDGNIRQIVTELRAPRAILAILVGGGLALSGAVFQALLRNPSLIPTYWEYRAARLQEPFLPLPLLPYVLSKGLIVPL